MVVVIPAYEPNEELENLVSELNCMNYRIVIVNDGSSPDKNVIFERLKDKATILHHTVNYGLRYSGVFSQLSVFGIPDTS